MDVAGRGNTHTDRPTYSFMHFPPFSSNEDDVAFPRPPSYV